MLRTIHKTTLLAAAGLAVAMVAQAAGAAMITQWDYTILSGFSNAMQADGTPVDFSPGSTMSHSGQGAGFDNDYTKISASDGSATSSIAIDGSVTGSGLTTNGPGVAGATFTHDNQVIDLGTNTLESFKLDTSLSLTANAPPSESGGQVSVPVLTFNSFFTETDNTVGQSNCAVQDGGPACSDIFVLGNAGTLPGSLNDDGDFVISQDFNAGTDNRLYTLFLTIDGLGLLDDDMCTSAGADSGCIGLTTMENKLNEFTTNLRIVSAVTPVPEPGSLAIMLMGLGLVGIGFTVRRRNGRQMHV